MDKLQNLFKKRGFIESLRILSSFENAQAIQMDFFRKFDEQNSYYNAFLRIRKELLEYGLIQYTCDQKGNKIIFLTSKGSNVLSKIDDLVSIIEQ